MSNTEEQNAVPSHLSRSPQLDEEFQKDIATYRKGMARSPYLIAFLMLGYFVCVAYALTYQSSLENFLGSLIVFPLLLISISMCSNYFACRALTKFAQQDDIRALFPLLESLSQYIHTQRTLHYTVNAIIRLFPHLKNEHQPLFKHEHLRILHLFLQNNNEQHLVVSGGSSVTSAPRLPRGLAFELRCATLRVLIHIGNDESVSVIQRLLKKRARTPNQGRLREVAEEALAALQARLEKEKEPQHLLRPADERAYSQQTLLRSAQANATELPIELLRPTSQNGS